MPRKSERFGILRDPFAIAAFCLLPYVIIYFARLWGHAHYQFFPISLLVTLLLIKQRINRVDLDSSFKKGLAFCLLVIGGPVAWIAALFASPWIAYLSFLFVATGGLMRWKDAQTDRSLSYLAIPLAVLWQPPYSPNVTGDGVLIAKLQNASAGIASSGLDFLGVIHDAPGTVIHCVGKSFGIEEACSGIQSFFLLVSCASLLIAWYRRPFVQSLLLFGAAAFWAVLVNALRIATIPVAFVTLEVDLSHGLGHTLLGLLTMGIGLGLLLSSDQLFVSFLRTSETPQKISADNKGGRQLSWVYALPFLPILGLQLYDLSASFGRESKGIDFFYKSPLVEIVPADGPGEILDWEQGAYSHEDRIRGADFGERSDSWDFLTDVGRVNVSLDQAFPGWHELTVCYTNVGWRLLKREVTIVEGWDTVFAQLESPEGKQAYLLFSMCDKTGQFVDAPKSWDLTSSLLERIRNRLTPSVRSGLFGSAAYQIQLFATSASPIDSNAAQELRAGFVECREHLRLILKNKSTVSPPSVDE